MIETPEGSESAPQGVSPDNASTERRGFIDVAKALGVIAVILGHTQGPDVLVSMVYSYHLALFFFISGYLYNDKYSLRPWDLVRRRFITLYVPFVGWNAGYALLHNAFLAINVYSTQAGWGGGVSVPYSSETLREVIVGILTLSATEQLAGALWFLISLIIVNVVFGAVSFVVIRLVKRNTEYVRLLAVTAVFTIGFLNLIPFARPAFLNVSFVAAMIFYFGFLYRRHEAKIPLNWFAAAAALVILYLGRGGVNLGGNQYASVGALLAVTTAGIYANVVLAKRLERQRFLQYVGRNTIFIVATHFLAFKIVSLVVIRAQGLPDYMLAQFPVITGTPYWWIAYAAVGLVAPVAVKLGIDTIVGALGRLGRGRSAPIAPTP